MIAKEFDTIFLYSNKKTLLTMSRMIETLKGFPKELVVGIITTLIDNLVANPSAMKVEEKATLTGLYSILVHFCDEPTKAYCRGLVHEGLGENPVPGYLSGCEMIAMMAILESMEETIPK
jgi:hypothetical protein